MILSSVAGILTAATLTLHSPALPNGGVPHANTDITGTVIDSTNGQPLQSAEVTLSTAAGARVMNTLADAFGRFTIHNVGVGSYAIAVHMLGFRAITRPLTIDATSSTQSIHFAMTPVGLNLDAIQVTATVPVSVDTRTGDQVFKQQDFHGAPTQTTVFQPEIYIENAFNKKYLLKGAFFSGASVGRPRSIQFRLKASF